MHVVAALLSYPPIRYIGSELATAHLLEALVARGHTATVTVGERAGWRGWTHNGVRVVHRRDWRKAGRPDVVLVHADAHLPGTLLARRSRCPVVAFAHNGQASVATGLRQSKPALVCVAADWLRAELGHPDALLVRPWTDVYVDPTHGDAVTLINLNENKGGDLFWRLVAAMPDVDFLGVRGGYGVQVDAPFERPGNATVLPHMPADDMDARVWSRTRVLLMPSQRETWGRTAVEASARGVPVVAHPAPGLRECLGDAGTFVDRGDVGGWVAAVRRLLDGRRWPAASRRAVAHARALDLDVDVDTFCTAIETLGRPS